MTAFLRAACVALCCTAVLTSAQDAVTLPPIPSDLSQESVMLYIGSLYAQEPADGSVDARQAHVEALSGRVDELLAKPLDDETTHSVLSFRFMLFQFSKALGVDGAAAAEGEWITSLANDKRPTVQHAATGFSLAREAQGESLATGDRDAWADYLKRFEAYLTTDPMTDLKANITLQVSELSQLAAPDDLTAATHEVMATRFAESDDERYQEAAPNFAGVARRLRLPGREMVLSGSQPDGSTFDIASQRGKVVLVDFWATNCPICIEEFPTLATLREKHAADGFEIVSVNLDDSQQAWTDFLKSTDVPGLPVQDLNAGDAVSHPNADRYSIYQTPYKVLLGRDGNVIKLDPLVEELDELVSTALGRDAG